MSTYFVNNPLTPISLSHALCNVMDNKKQVHWPLMAGL